MNSKTVSRPGSHIGYYRLDPKLYQQLQRLAEKDDRPVSWIVRAAISEYINRQKNT